MPLLDGVSAIARLRSDHPHLCLIALTGDEAPDAPLGGEGVRRGRRSAEERVRRRAPGPADCGESPGLVNRADSPSRVAPAREHFSRKPKSGEGRNRTGDTTVFSRVLYQLSYLAAPGSVATSRSRDQRRVTADFLDGSRRDWFAPLARLSLFARLARKKGRPGRCLRAANVLVTQRAYAAGAFRATSAVPLPAAKSANSVKPRSASSRAQHLGRHVDRRLRRRRRTRTRPTPPGAVTRPSSSKNGIMFASDTRSNERVGVRELLRVGPLEAHAVRELRRRQLPRLGEHRPRRGRRRRPLPPGSAARAGTPRGRCRCRDRARARAAPRSSRAPPRATRTLSGCASRPTAARSGRTASESAGGSSGHSRGRRTTWFVVNRANLRPRSLEHQSREPDPDVGAGLRGENVSAALPPLIAIAMFS